MKNTEMKVIKGDGLDPEVKAADLYTPLDHLPKHNIKYDLTKDQVYWYNYFGKMLVATKKLVLPDLIHLHRLARSVDYYLQAEARIQKYGYDSGLIQTFKNGTTNVSAHVTIREKMLKEIDSLSAHFGFSFLDRKKLQKDAPKVDTGQQSIFDMLNEQMKKSS